MTSPDVAPAVVPPAAGVAGRLVRVSCRQLAPTIGDLAANVALSTSAVRSALDDGAQIVVLPELVTSGYVFESLEEAEAVAITPDHPLFAAWAREAARADAVVVGGFCERGDGVLHNSAAIVDSSGVRAVYRKTHLWDREKLWFQPGDRLPPVVETALGRIGVAICYDIEFPELVRHLAVNGADLVAVPTNWPLVPRPAGERAAEVINAMAAARANHVFVACCDRDGTERGQQWTRGTSIIGTDGWPVATIDDPAVVLGRSSTATADLNLASARDKRLTDLCDALADRRTDLYGG